MSNYCSNKFKSSDTKLEIKKRSAKAVDTQQREEGSKFAQGLLKSHRQGGRENFHEKV